MAKKIKVSEKTVQELRKGTMAGNLAKAKNASPEMKEALIRFYGAKRVAQAGGVTDSKRAQLGTLPRKSVAMAKPKTTTMGSRTGGKITVDTAANEKRKAEFNKRTDRAVTALSVIPAVRAGRAVATGAKVVSGINRAKDTAKFYGDAAKNMAPRAKKAAEMKNVQQAVATASKKKASGLQGAATRKANAKAAEKARLERNAKAAATRAKNAKAKAAAAKKTGKK
jgi:hypothetical protein